VTGMPDVVLSRGRVVVDGDKFLGRTGQRQVSPEVHIFASQRLILFMINCLESSFCNSVSLRDVAA
jgi:hypothetical protein